VTTLAGIAETLNGRGIPPPVAVTGPQSKALARWHWRAKRTGYGETNVQISDRTRPGQLFIEVSTGGAGPNCIDAYKFVNPARLVYKCPAPCCWLNL
jgi:hypothetical protein